MSEWSGRVDSGWKGGGERGGGGGGGIGGLRMASLWYRIMTSVMRDAIIAGKRRPGHRQKYYLWASGGWAKIVILAIVKYGRLVLSAPGVYCDDVLTHSCKKCMIYWRWIRGWRSGTRNNARAGQRRWYVTWNCYFLDCRIIDTSRSFVHTICANLSLPPSARDRGNTPR